VAADVNSLWVKNGTAVLVRGDTLIVLVQEASNLEAWQQAVLQIHDLSAKYPEGILLFSLILPSADPPNDTTRAQMQMDTRRLGPRLRKIVTVALGDTMRVGIVRAIMRAMMLLGGQSSKQVLAATIREGLDRVQEAAGPHTPSRAELQAGVEALGHALGVTRCAVLAS
jgi:hypothetical protein